MLQSIPDRDRLCIPFNYIYPGRGYNVHDLDRSVGEPYEVREERFIDFVEFG